MFRIIALLVALPLLVAATCADPKYPAAVWQKVQEARQHEAVAPLEWDSSNFPLVDQRAQALADGAYPLYGSKPSVGVGRWPDGRFICEIMGESVYEGRTAWLADYTASKCLLDPQYRHAAIAAYIGSDGSIYEVMWLVTD